MSPKLNKSRDGNLQSFAHKMVNVSSAEANSVPQTCPVCTGGICVCAGDTYGASSSASSACPSEAPDRRLCGGVKPSPLLAAETLQRSHVLPNDDKDAERNRNVCCCDSKSCLCLRPSSSRPSSRLALSSASSPLTLAPPPSSLTNSLNRHLLLILLRVAFEGCESSGSSHDNYQHDIYDIDDHHHNRQEDHNSERRRRRGSGKRPSSSDDHRNSNENCRDNTVRFFDDTRMMKEDSSPRHSSPSVRVGPSDSDVKVRSTIEIDEPVLRDEYEQESEFLNAANNVLPLDADNYCDSLVAGDGDDDNALELDIKNLQNGLARHVSCQNDGPASVSNLTEGVAEEAVEREFRDTGDRDDDNRHARRRQESGRRQTRRLCSWSSRRRQGVRRRYAFSGHGLKAFEVEDYYSTGDDIIAADSDDKNGGQRKVNGDDDEDDDGNNKRLTRCFRVTENCTDDDDGVEGVVELDKDNKHSRGHSDGHDGSCVDMTTTEGSWSSLSMPSTGTTKPQPFKFVGGDDQTLINEILAARQRRRRRLLCRQLPDGRRRQELREADLEKQRGWFNPSCRAGPLSPTPLSPSASTSAGGFRQPPGIVISFAMADKTSSTTTTTRRTTTMTEGDDEVVERISLASTRTSPSSPSSSPTSLSSSSSCFSSSSASPTAFWLTSSFVASSPPLRVEEVSESPSCLPNARRHDGRPAMLSLPHTTKTSNFSQASPRQPPRMSDEGEDVDEAVESSETPSRGCCSSVVDCTIPAGTSQLLSSSLPQHHAKLPNGGRLNSRFSDKNNKTNSGTERGPVGSSIVEQEECEITAQAQTEEEVLNCLPSSSSSCHPNTRVELPGDATSLKALGKGKAFGQGMTGRTRGVGVRRQIQQPPICMGSSSIDECPSVASSRSQQQSTMTKASDEENFLRAAAGDRVTTAHTATAIGTSSEVKIDDLSDDRYRDISDDRYQKFEFRNNDLQRDHNDHHRHHHCRHGRCCCCRTKGGDLRRQPPSPTDLATETTAPASSSSSCSPSSSSCAKCSCCCCCCVSASILGGTAFACPNSSFRPVVDDCGGHHDEDHDAFDDCLRCCLCHHHHHPCHHHCLPYHDDDHQHIIDSSSFSSSSWSKSPSLRPSSLSSSRDVWPDPHTAYPLNSIVAIAGAGDRIVRWQPLSCYGRARLSHLSGRIGIALRAVAAGGGQHSS